MLVVMLVVVVVVMVLGCVGCLEMIRGKGGCLCVCALWKGVVVMVLMVVWWC